MVTWGYGGAELKGGSIGKPDDWLGAYVRSIHSGLRFPFERMNRFGCQVTGTGIGSSGIGRSAIGNWHLDSGG